MSAREVARGWYCPSCRRVLKQPITPLGSDLPGRFHNMVCDAPMVRCSVVER